RMRARLHRRAVLGVDHPAANEAADLVLGDVLAREDREASGRSKRSASVDLLQVCMRVRRADEHRPRLSRTIDVVGILAFAGDEALVFLALDGSADAGCGHGFPPGCTGSTPS